MNMPPPPSGPWSDPQQWATADAGETEQPRSIRLAVRLMWIGAGLALLNLLATFVQVDEIRDQIDEMAVDSGDPLTEDQLDTAVAFALTIAGLIGVVAIGLWIWMATTNGQGRSWARTVATVLGVLNVVSTLVGVFAGQLAPLALIVSLVSIALAVTILVMLYRPESTRYYDLRSP